MCMEKGGRGVKSQGAQENGFEQIGWSDGLQLKWRKERRKGKVEEEKKEFNSQEEKKKKRKNFWLFLSLSLSLILKNGKLRQLL